MQSSTFATIGLLSLTMSLGTTSNDACGQALKLDDRVAPPQTVAVPPLPYVAQPTPRAANAKEQKARAVWSLPISEVPRVSAAIKDEQRRVAWRHAALDSPGLAAAERPVLPVETRMPSVTGSFARGPQVDQPLDDGRAAHEAEIAPRVSEDPKAMVAFRFLTTPVPTLPPLPAPLLRLTIPDPFVTIQASRLPSADLDRDPPAVPLDRPNPPPAR